MAQNKSFRSGPIALTNTLTTNILNPGTTTGGTNGGGGGNLYIIIKKIRILNKTGSAATCSFWLGATGGNLPGTEVIGQGLSVAPNLYIDSFDVLRLDVADFLVGGASVANALTFYAEGEIGVA